MDGWQIPGYTEVTELGRGGSGRVIAAVEQTSGEQVAVKYLADRLAGDEQFRAAFRAEAAILAGLDMPHVARVRRYIESADGAAIVMDLVGGAALREILARFGPTGPQAALSVLKGSLLGLAGAHRAGIVHRDYKPENVMVDPAGSSMLIDFGIALRAGTPGHPAGTPGYAAPEQWAGAAATPASDIYAAAVTFTECITGTPPPRVLVAPPLASQADAQGAATAADPSADLMGPRLAGLIARATAADPAARPADATALLAELQDAADERYGADWEESGRADLARSVAALLALAAGAAVGATVGGATAGPSGAAAAAPAQGPATSAATVLTRARRAVRTARAGSGHGRAIIISAAAAAVVVVGAAVAIAIATHHQPAPGNAGQPGRPTAASPGRSHAAKPPTPGITTPAASAPAAATSGLSGRWLGQYSGAYHGTFTLTWHQSGSKLSGTIKLSAPADTLPIHGTVKGGAIRFGTVGSVGITYSGTVSGNSMSGTYQVHTNGSAGGPWSASRSS